MSLKIRAVLKGDIAKAFQDMKNPMAVKATAAMDKVSDEIKTRGRANIAAGGFSSKWQKALRVTRYPKSGVSLKPAVFAFHKIPYAEVFEIGATIHGKPLLWIPLSSTPAKIGGKRTTPKLFSVSFGALHFVQPSSGPPLLVAKFSGRSRGGKLSAAGLRRGGSEGGTNVPVFVGLDAVKLRKRFGLRAIFAQAASHLKANYR